MLLQYELKLGNSHVLSRWYIEKNPSSLSPEYLVVTYCSSLNKRNWIFTGSRLKFACFIEGILFEVESRQQTFKYKSCFFLGYKNRFPQLSLRKGPYLCYFSSAGGNLPVSC